MSNPNARARAGQDRANLYNEITDRIIAELEAGRVPWVQPWCTAAAKAPLAMPKNASTNRQYKQKSAGRRVKNILCYLCCNLAWQVRSDPGDQGSRNNRPSLDDVW